MSYCLIAILIRFVDMNEIKGSDEHSYTGDPLDRGGSVITTFNFFQLNQHRYVCD